MSSTQASSSNMCAVCCDPFTKQVRKPIVCPVSTCGYSACQTCYKTFLTTEGITSSKCMKCNTEFTTAFLKNHFPESFIKADLRQHFTEILVQRQIAQLPMSQPKAEREIQARSKASEVAEIEKLMKTLLIQKRILQDDIRFLRSAPAHGSADNETVATFQRKCCDPECPGFVSSAWKCGICSKFSCSHCHEVKGMTREEIEAHECNPETVESIKFLKIDTKPCPACGVYIHKTAGCDQMFCTSCKQLWSWKTGRIEKNGHNPHYLEWMRNRGAGGGGGLQRDPQDVQCGREVDRTFTYAMSAQYARLVIKCKDETVRASLQTFFEKQFPELARSLIHLRHYDIRHFQEEADTEQRGAALRVGYLCKDFNTTSFRRRVFNLNKTGEISRNIMDLLVAVQNAAADILYRAHKQMTDLTSYFDRICMREKVEPIDEMQAYRAILSTLSELTELHNYAQTCLEEVYWTHSASPTHSFKKSSWFALTN
jgi:hypothetical protein